MQCNTRSRSDQSCDWLLLQGIWAPYPQFTFSIKGTLFTSASLGYPQNINPYALIVIHTVSSSRC